jgi:hypothetical protein
MLIEMWLRLLPRCGCSDRTDQTFAFIFSSAALFPFCRWRGFGRLYALLGSRYSFLHSLNTPIDETVRFMNIIAFSRTSTCGRGNLDIEMTADNEKAL